MGAPLWHRGPDSGGTWHQQARDSLTVGLVHRRLAIRDTSSQGAQPMLSPSGRFATVFNGEIYNSEELRDQLRSGGVRFRGTSDTEVLV
ncbi:asparagine synthetase B, partial [bacterium]|nr:asparagine synthetase B [bacterium]